MDGYKNEENPFQKSSFYMAFFATIMIYSIMIWFFVKSSGDWLLFAFFSSLFLFCIPCAVFGLAAWAILRKKYRNVALGILWGSLIPLTISFVSTGSCLFGIGLE